MLLVAGDEALPDEASQPQGWVTYQRCRAYLERHCVAVHSLGELSRACGVGEANLCRLFKRYADGSPYQVLQRLKMARAAALLLDARLLVKQVGGLVGFDDPYHFSKAFKRVYGLSPEAFRSRGRGVAPVASS
jgi:AraC-like DNA-binding protein